MTGESWLVERERRLTAEREATERWARELAEAEERLRQDPLALPDGRVMPQSIDEQRRRRAEAQRLRDDESAAEKELPMEAPPSPPAPDSRRRLKLIGLLAAVPLVGLIVLAVIVAGTVERESAPKSDASPAVAAALGSCSSACLEAAPATTAAFADPAACDGSGRRLCLVPMGSVSPEVLNHLAGYYRERYGLTVGVLPPLSIGGGLVDSKRSQAGSDSLLGLMAHQYPAQARDAAVVMIGVTPVDIYPTQHDLWTFTFSAYSPTFTVGPKRGVVSYARMAPAVFGYPADPGLTMTRLQKAANLMVGSMLLGLPQATDPLNAMYSNVLGLEDLDRVAADLPAGR